MIEYRAKTKHKRNCDLCDEPILVGDDCVRWAWVNPDTIGGNIMRVHAACYEVEELSPREEFSPGSWCGEADALALEKLSSARYRAALDVAAAMVAGVPGMEAGSDMATRCARWAIEHGASL